ncbi:transcriptional regulator IbrB, partial [Escherichia coli O104:H4 str. LB226692]
MTSEVKLKTGGDPRSLPDYAALSDIVRDLSRLGWMDERIGTELGMDQ